jgi:hypothetical protein
MSVEEAATKIGLNLEAILPIHRLNPALHIAYIEARKETLRDCIHAGNRNRLKSALYYVAQLLELDEIISICEKDAQVMDIWRNASMGIVECRYAIGRLVRLPMFGAVGGAIIVELNLKARGSIQIEQDNC